MRVLALMVVSLMVACAAENETKDPSEDPRVPALVEQQKADIAELRSLRNADTGWASVGGDAMLWEGKAAAVTCDVDLTKAETSPGKFQRDVDGETSENPAWSDWSKDMGTGLLAYAWRCKDLALLQRHAAYGEAHKAVHHEVPIWRMGEPVGDGRGFYFPAFVGRVYQTIYALGGENSVQRLWPDLYQKGLVDFQAHLQVMNIWHRGEVAEALRKSKSEDAVENEKTPDDAGAVGGTGLTLDVTTDQYDALKQHAERDVRDPFFQAVYGTYTGDMTKAIDACLAADGYAGEYVRCDGNPRTCQLAAKIFACDIVLRRYGQAVH